MGVCDHESPSHLRPSLPKANAPLGRFARACVNPERDTLGRVAEPALTPKQCTETLGVSRETWVQVCESPSNLGPSLRTLYSFCRNHHAGKARHSEKAQQRRCQSTQSRPIELVISLWFGGAQKNQNGKTPNTGRRPFFEASWRAHGGIVG